LHISVYLNITKVRSKPKIVLVGQPLRPNEKAGHPRIRWEDFIRKDLWEMGTPWEGLKRGALNKLKLRRSKPQVAWWCSELLLVGTENGNCDFS